MKIYIWGSIINPKRRGQDQYWSSWDGISNELEIIKDDRKIPEQYKRIFRQIEVLPGLGSIAKQFFEEDSRETVLCYVVPHERYDLQIIVILTTEEFNKLYGSHRFMGFSEVPQWAHDPQNLKSDTLAKDIFPNFYSWWSEVELPNFSDLKGIERTYVAVTIDNLMSKLENDKRGVSTLPIGIFCDEDQNRKEASNVISEEERLTNLRRILCFAVRGLPYKISKSISFNSASTTVLNSSDIFCSARKSVEFDKIVHCHIYRHSDDEQNLKQNIKHPYAQYVAESDGDPCKYLEEVESILELDQSIEGQKLLRSANEIRDSLERNCDIDATNLSKLLKSYSKIHDKKIMGELQIILKEIAFRIYFFNFDAFAKWPDINLLETFLYTQEKLFVAPNESYHFLQGFSVEYLDAIFYQGIHQDKKYTEYVRFLRHCEQNKDENFELINTISVFLHVFSKKRLGNEKLMRALASYLVGEPREEVIDYLSIGIDILSSDVVVEELKKKYVIKERKDFCDALKNKLPQDERTCKKYKQFVNNFYKVDTSLILDEMKRGSERNKNVYASYSHTIQRKKENTGMQKNGNRGWIVAFDIFIAALFLAFYAFGAPAFTEFICSKIFAVGAVAYSQNVNRAFAVLMLVLSLAVSVWHIILIAKYDRITLRICALYLFCSLGLLALYFCLIFCYFFINVVV